MIFVDTNYFVRFLLHDNNSQYEDAKKLFLEAATGKVQLISSTVAFFEVAWVLRSVYGKDKKALVTILHQLLKLNVEFNERLLFISSLNLFSKSNLSLEDCYNLVFARKSNAKTFKTFDQKLAKYSSKPS